MNEIEAKARIAELVAMNDEPQLASHDLDRLTELAARKDEYGRARGEAGWVPTWNIPYAAAKGWELKSTRLTTKFMFMSGGKMFSRNQMFEHCMQMARHFRGQQGIGSIPLGGVRPFV
jgi:hypothetical protein